MLLVFITEVCENDVADKRKQQHYSLNDKGASAINFLNFYKKENHAKNTDSSE